MVGGVALAAEPGHADALGVSQVELRAAKVVAMDDAEFGGGGVAALDHDFGVFDETVLLAPEGAELQRGLAELAALDEALQPDFIVDRVAAGRKGLVDALDRLPVVRFVFGQRECPVAPGDGVLEAV